MANLAKTNNNTAIQSNTDFDIPEGYICTFDFNTIEGKIQLATALNGAVTMKDKVGEVLRVMDFVTTQGVRSRTGEVCTNTYLICDDGNVYMTQSTGILRSVKVIVGLFTDQNTHEFTNPVSLGVGLEIREQKLPNGNTLKTLVPVQLEDSE